MPSEDDFLTPEERRAKRREAKAAKARQAQDDSVIQNLMGFPAGRAWMLDKITACRVFHSIYDQNPHITYLNEGRRNIGLMLLADIMRACPEAYVQMMQEQNNAGPGPLDRRDHDDDRNYDSVGRWIGEGDAPDDE